MPCAVSKQLSCCGIKTTWTIGWCKSKLDPIVPDLKRQKSGNVTLPVFAADLSVFTPVCYFLWHLSRFLPSLLSLPPFLSSFPPSIFLSPFFPVPHPLSRNRYSFVWASEPARIEFSHASFIISFLSFLVPPRLSTFQAYPMILLTSWNLISSVENILK